MLHKARSHATSRSPPVTSRRTIPSIAYRWVTSRRAHAAGVYNIEGITAAFLLGSWGRPIPVFII